MKVYNDKELNTTKPFTGGDRVFIDGKIYTYISDHPSFKNVSIVSPLIKGGLMNVGSNKIKVKRS